jgi:hypothetical protein
MGPVLALWLLLQDYDSQHFDLDYMDAVRIVDLNDDGRPDLVVQSGLDLRIHFQDGRGRYPDKPSLTARFDDRTFLWMMQPDERGKFGPNSFLSMSSRGVHRLKPENGRFASEDLVVHPTMFEGKTLASHPPIYQEFAPDVTGDGRPDLLLFTRDRLLVMARDGGDWTLRDKVDAGVESHLPQWSMAYSPVAWSTVVPQHAFGDVNGDRRPDLLWYKDEELAVLLQGEDGRFSPLEKKVLLSRRKHSRRRGMVQLEVPPVLADIDRDGLIDVAYSEVSHGRVYLRYGVPGRADFSEPEEREIPDHWNLATQLVDLDGRGPRTLAMWMIPKLGLSSGIEAFVSKTVTVVGYFFEAGEGGRVPKAARSRISMTIPYTLTISRSTNTFPIDIFFEPNFEGDLDGDGLRDLAIAVRDVIYLRRGRAEGIVGEQPDREIKLSPPTRSSRVRLIMAELNGDSRSDIVVLYSDPLQSKARVEIKYSK